MTFIDILVLIPLCWFGFLGFKNGFIYEITSVAAIVLGVWFTYRFSDWSASMLSQISFAKPVIFILIFSSIVLLVHFVGKLMTRVVKLVIPGAIDHIFGLLFGIGKVVVVFSVIFYLINSIDKNEILFKKEVKEKSFTYSYIEPIVPQALRWESVLDF